MKNAIEIKNFVKRYDSKFCLGNFSLTVPSGVIVGLIGENGAGKTTFIKSLLDVLHADGGEVKIFGLDYKKNEKLIKEDIGVVFDNMFFPEILTANDIDRIMKEVYKNWDKELFFKYMRDFQLPVHKSIKQFSKGMKKKLEIATALSHKPKLLILDEPTSGLDPVVRNEVLDLFLDFVKDEEHTILLSTHITSDLEHIADHIIFLDKGKIMLDKSKDDIIDYYGVLKCDESFFKKLSKEDYCCYKKNKYSYEVLVHDIRQMKKKYKDAVIDKITLETLMVLMIKGERLC